MPNGIERICLRQKIRLHQAPLCISTVSSTTLMGPAVDLSFTNPNDAGVGYSSSPSCSNFLKAVSMRINLNELVSLKILSLLGIRII